LKLKIDLNITGRNFSLSDERQPRDCTLGFVGPNAPMSRPTPLLVLLAMMAFAADSLLCRMALKNTLIDAGIHLRRLRLSLCGRTPPYFGKNSSQ
jgi:hypothetical protein